MDLYRSVRLACRDGMSTRGGALHWDLTREREEDASVLYSLGFRNTVPVRRPKLDGFTGFIDEWLRRDREDEHRMQRHTAKRIFERLRDEHGFTGGYTIVKDYVREQRCRRLEMYAPHRHSPGHGQADLGEAWAFIDGVNRKVHFFAIDLPHRDASYVRAYPLVSSLASR